MLGGFDTSVAICVIKPKKFVRYEHVFTMIASNGDSFALRKNWKTNFTTPSGELLLKQFKYYARTFMVSCDTSYIFTVYW